MKHEKKTQIIFVLLVRRPLSTFTAACFDAVIKEWDSWTPDTRRCGGSYS